ncbi:hypothetical protein RJ640_023126, partial [Escallonia rubra]
SKGMQFFGGSEISPSPPAPTASGNNAHMMYVFNRNGICLLYREWNRPHRTLSAQQDHKLMFGLLFSLKSLTAKMDPTSSDCKFSLIIVRLGLVGIWELESIARLFELLYASRNGGGDGEVNCKGDSQGNVRHFAFLTWFLAEKGNLGVPQLPGQGCSFHSFRTNTYKLSFMETPSGIKIILVTHPRAGDLREPLKYIYNLYVEYVVKNPLYTPGTPIKCELFNTTLDQYVRGLG